MALMATDSVKLLPLISMLLALFAQQAAAWKTHYLDWEIKNATLTRDCHTVSVATVNGMFPGPIVEINEGDTLVIKVTNRQIYPVTMHWHGIRQFHTNYADGPAHITQCPIQTGGSYIYEFTVDSQRGTFFYHAHIDWLRATVHGALIVHPLKKLPSTYGKVEQEIPVIIGEWFGMPANQYEAGFLNTLEPLENATSITPTINGYPGPKYNCSKGAQVFKLEKKKTYLLRIINAAMNNDYWFSVADHKLTVVGADGNYLKPFTTKYLPLLPGQTTDVLVTTNQKPGKYYFGINVGPIPIVGRPPPRIPALAMFEYEEASSSASPVTPKFPNNVTLKPLNQYVAKLHAFGDSVITLPKKLNKDLIWTIGTAWVDCKKPEPCVQKVMGMIQNISFDDPVGTSILQAYASGANGVYQTNFPDEAPSLKVNLTGTDPHYRNGTRGTRVKTLNFGDNVRIVFQNVFAAGILDHPVHLHGHDFYVIGRGYGIYNSAKDPKSFNLVDPPAYNTFGVPNGGWLAIQFIANNPGVWLLHCHFDRHKSWGMEMVFITKNGHGSAQSLAPPLHPLPKCTAGGLP
ncbi:hypothetical protein M758_11G003900 [Ceratodon purpureus]|nr:hypothetical protein M758_11G003900 [Ceratodon purpureus]KAG0600057.1 hypothetical protein M758_11G003900 [Ceratodon purpureus]